MARTKTDTDKPQHKRFVETARKLGCDEDENRFNATLKKIAKAEPQKKKNGKDVITFQITKENKLYLLNPVAHNWATYYRLVSPNRDNSYDS